MAWWERFVNSPVLRQLSRGNKIEAAEASGCKSHEEVANNNRVFASHFLKVHGDDGRGDNVNELEHG